MEGCRHDSSMLRHSKLIAFFESHTSIFNGKFIYGDPAYGVTDWTLSGYKGYLDDEKRKQFNKLMSSVREAVEWNFGLLKALWKFIDFKKQHKILLSPVARIILVAMLLTNCHTCYHEGNQISMYFDLKPPSLEQYLSL
jgi:nuclease HARBI1